MRRVPFLALVILAAALAAACDSKPESEPDGLGTYETLLGWIGQDALELPGWGPLPPLAFGDIAAWREASGIAAARSQEDEVPNGLATLEWVHEHGAGPWQAAAFTSFLGTDEGDGRALGLQFDFSAQVSEVLGFGRRNVEAFAGGLYIESPWGLIAGQFDPDEVAPRLEDCDDCVPIASEEIEGVTVHSWGTGEPDPSRSGSRPFFDHEGWGVALAVFEDHVVRTVDVESMRRVLTGPTLADLEPWRATAERLDEMGAWYAQLLPPAAICCAPGPFQPMLRPESDLPLLDPWEVLGVGGGLDDEGVPYTTYLVTFEDGDTAAANLERFEARLAAVLDDSPLNSEVRWRDLSAIEASAEGAHLVLTLRGLATSALNPFDPRPLFWSEADAAGHEQRESE